METIKKFIAFILLGFTLILPTNSQTLHAIIFANTKCPGEEPGSMGIGPSVTCDYQRMKIEFETMASFLNYKKDFQWYEGSPNHFSRTNLESALNTFLVEKTTSSSSIIQDMEVVRQKKHKIHFLGCN